MKELNSFADLAQAFKRNLGVLDGAFEVAMEASAVAVATEARQELGEYQREDMGPAAPWDELKQATKNDRVRQGYPENDPLLRSGDLRDSIEYQAGPKGFVVGSVDPVALYQFAGTPQMPPRDALSPALHRNVSTILHNVGTTVEETLAGAK